MIGYVILSKQVNPLTEGGYDYASALSDVLTDPVEAEYMLGGIASQESVEYIIREIDL